MTGSVRRGRIAALALAVAVILAGCSASPSPSLSLADCAQADANGVVQLTADNLAFDAPCISVAANTAFTIRLVNKDSSPHNVAIYDTRDKVNEYLRGEIIDISDTIDYAIDPLPVDEYYFLCTVHPSMNGPLFVGPSE
ncbi:MAG: cupredoxin domain-containing protein [Candidatus Limnocylindria bacterium]